MANISELFENPTPDVAEVVELEREAGLDELELVVRGLIKIEEGGVNG